MIKQKLKELGWNVSENTECWEENGHIFFTVDPDDITGYTVEVDPETGRSRHIGNGQGCFWTEWEQFSLVNRADRKQKIHLPFIVG